MIPDYDEVEGSNIFVKNLFEKQLDPHPDKGTAEFLIEDNIGESIHIHYRNTRIELSVSDFMTLYKSIKTAKEAYNGNR